MSNSSDKPFSQDSLGNNTGSEQAPPASAVDAPASSGLPSYMTGAATSDDDDRDAASVTHGPSGTAESLPDGHEPASDSAASVTPATSFTLGDAVKAAGHGPAITVTPDGAAHVPPEALDSNAADQTASASATAAPQGSAAAASGKASPSSPAGAKDKSAGKAASKPRPSGSSAGSPSGPSFGKSHPLLTVEQPMPPSMASRLYTVFALFPLLWLTLGVVLQTLFSLNARDLWAGEEVLNAALFRNLLAHGSGLVLSLGGDVFVDKPPLYFWFLRGLHEALRTDGPMLHLTAAAVSCLLFLWAALGLGRSVGRLDGRSNLASGIILLSTCAVMALTRYASAELLFAALVTASLTLLYRSFVSPGNSPVGMVAGFILAGAAALVQGLPGLVIPILTLVLFALWRLTPQRFFRLDFFIGLLAGLAVVAVWPALIYLENGNTALLTDVLLERQVLAPALAALGLEGGWLKALALLPLLLLPWLLAFFFLPWHRFLGKSMREGIAASRRPEKEGLAFLWCAALAVIVLVSSLKGQSVWAYLPALPPLAALAGRAVLGLCGRRASGFRLGMAVLVLIAGVLVILYGLMLFNILPQPGFLGLPEWKTASHGGFFVTGAILLVAGALIWFGLGSSRPEGVLLLMLLAAVGLGYPLGSLVAPHFDALLSPKTQALTLKAYADRGYNTVSFNVPLGTYDFYAGNAVKPMNRAAPKMLDTSAALAGLGVNSAVAMPLADYETLADKPESFAVAQRQWIGCKEYVLLASPVIEGLPPAAVPYKPAPDIIHEILKLAGLEGWIAPKAAPETPKPAATAPVPAPPMEPAPVEPAPGEAAPAEPADGGGATPAELTPADDGGATPSEAAPSDDGSAVPAGPPAETPPAPVEEAPSPAPSSGDAPAAPREEQAPAPAVDAAAEPAPAEETPLPDAPASAEPPAVTEPPSGAEAAATPAPQEPDPAPVAPGTDEPTDSGAPGTPE